jgi:hypothetical protein
MIPKLLPKIIKYHPKSLTSQRAFLIMLSGPKGTPTVVFLLFRIFFKLGHDIQELGY